MLPLKVALPLPLADLLALTLPLVEPDRVRVALALPL